ncbi:MAG: hypothetical protein FWC95_00540 [Defluviitaleaceae bacterium]|nr:hypothetical protein [Defluviitaleaceae bacterium]
MSIVCQSNEYLNSIKELKFFLSSARLYAIMCGKENVYEVYKKAFDICEAAFIICYIKNDDNFIDGLKSKPEVINGEYFIQMSSADDLRQYTKTLGCSEFKYHKYEYAVLFFKSFECDTDVYQKTILVSSIIPDGYERQSVYKTSASYSILFYKKNTDRDRNNNDRIKGKEAYIYLSPWITYGDSIMLYPVLKQFRAKKPYQKYNIIHLRNISYDVLTELLPEFNHLSQQMIDSFGSLLDILESDNDIYSLCDFLSFDILKKETKLHISRLISKQLMVDGMEEAIDKINNEYPTDEKSKFFVDMLRTRYKHIITVQFATDTDETELRNARIPYKKSWNYEFAQSFIDLCERNGIGVINLCNFPDKNFNNVIDMSGEPLLSLINIIKNMDMHVGVDSVFGHISGLFRIPNIIVFSRNTPHWIVTPDEKLRIFLSYVPFTSSFCLANEDGNGGRINPEVLFDRMRYLLRNPKVLNKNMVSYDTINFEYIL